MWCWYRDIGNRRGPMLVRRAGNHERSSCSGRADTSGNKRLVYVGGLCIAIVMVVGCTLVTPKEEPLRLVTAQELTTLLRHREAAIQSLKGLFSAKVRGGFIPIASRVEGAVYFRRPNALRLRGFTPLGNELFDFVQADDVYKLRLPLEGKTYAGHQSDMKDLGKLARFSQLSIWAMGGVLGTHSIARDEMVKVVEESGRYRLDVYAPATGGSSSSPLPIRHLWFDRRLLVVQEDWMGSNGEIEATIQYDDFRPLDELGRVPAQAMEDLDARFLRPFKITLQDGHGQGTVQVTFHEMHHNQAIRAEDLGQTS